MLVRQSHYRINTEDGLLCPSPLSPLLSPSTPGKPQRVRLQRSTNSSTVVRIRCSGSPSRMADSTLPAQGEIVSKP